MKRAAAVLVLMSINALTLPALAGDSGPRPFRIEGDCTESVVGVLVDAEKARALVPDGFVVREVAGKAQVNVFAEDCVVSVDDGAEFETTLSGTGVVLQSPAGVYGFTWNSDAGRYFSAYHRLGVGSLVPGSNYDARQVAPGVVHSEAQIPGDFSLTFDSGDATSPNDLEDAITSVHWGYGRFGAVKGTYPHDVKSVAGGIGVLEAAPGSPLAKLIGTDPVEAPGLFLRFHATGVVELAD